MRWADEREKPKKREVMEPRRWRLPTGETHPPTRRDRVIVFLVSLSFFGLLIPLAHHLHASLVGWIVMLTVIGLQVGAEASHRWKPDAPGGIA